MKHFNRWQFTVVLMEKHAETAQLYENNTLGHGNSPLLCVAHRHINTVPSAKYFHIAEQPVMSYSLYITV